MHFSSRLLVILILGLYLFAPAVLAQTSVFKVEDQSGNTLFFAVNDDGTVTCTNCIATDALADRAVTGAKIAPDAIQAGANVSVTRDASDNLIIDATGGGGSFSLPYSGSANTEANSAAFSVTNTGSGFGGRFISQSGSGGFGAALRADNTSTGSGIAGWFNAAGTDATLVVGNDGAGPLMKGFSNGQDRFRLTNSGTVISFPAANARGFSASSSGDLGSGSATVFAQNTGTGNAIAGWFAAHGTSAAIVAAQNGSGRILSGFSGGQRLFSVENDGVVHSKGFRIDDTTGDGLFIGNADGLGIKIESARWGVRIKEAGNVTQSSLVCPGSGNGFGVCAAEFEGVFVGEAGTDGMRVYSAGRDGLSVEYAGRNGVQVLEADLYAGWFGGDVVVSGFLSKGAGTFKIDHPLDPENKYLSHSFVESPDMMNVYNGNAVLNAAGEAVVELPDYFEALNRDFRYQLTAIGAPGPNLYIAEKISGNHFSIAGGTPGMEVSWQVTGIRHDPYAEQHRVRVEEDKGPEERGYYLHPEAYGHPRVRGVASRLAQ